MSTATIDVLPDTDVEEKTNAGWYPRWKVFCHNDDVTTMEFVVLVLHTIFGLSKVRANEVMLEVHNEDVALVGTYTKEQAEFRIDQAHAMARSRKFPLKLTMERE